MTLLSKCSVFLTSGFLLHFASILSYAAPYSQNVFVFKGFGFHRRRACSVGFCGENQMGIRNINGILNRNTIREQS